MTTKPTEEILDAHGGPAENTDREIWRERPGDYYADSIHVTASGGIGIDCGGMVYVLPVRKWHELASTTLIKSSPVEAVAVKELDGPTLAMEIWDASTCRDDTSARDGSLLILVPDGGAVKIDAARILERIRSCIAPLSNPEAPVTMAVPGEALNDLWALCYLHDWDPPKDGQEHRWEPGKNVFPEVHAFYRTWQEAEAIKRDMIDPSKYWVVRAKPENEARLTAALAAKPSLADGEK